MKTASELELDLRDRYVTNKYVPGQKMYNMKKSGNLFDDFFRFTDLQSGGKSDNKSDYYFKNTKEPAASTPDADGRYYHTVRDVTWQLFKTHVINDANRFYNMSDADRSICVNVMMKPAKRTKSELVNTMLAYCVWGTGNCIKEMELYQEWYNTDINSDIDSLGEKAIVDRITDIRLFLLSTWKTTKENPGQPAGVLNLWNLLKQY